MKNSIGTSVILTLSGESHGVMICAVLDGLAPGIPVSEEFIASQLSLRRPSGRTDTARREKDAFRVVSGVFEGCTTGSPICILIPNEDTRSEDYARNLNIPRPSHADFAASVKYGGFEDWRGGGHFSGRITAGIVAVGAIAIEALRRKGITLGTHILSCAGVADRPFEDVDDVVLRRQIGSIAEKDFPVISDCREAMEKGILEAKAAGDSLGGIIQTAVCSLPAGVGEPWFTSLEGAIANAVLSIGGIKGIEFGAGFALASMRGSQANDPFCIRDGEVRTRSNRSGGINGGISNGMPVIFNSVVKPTPSISLPQESVRLDSLESTELRISGRHDPAIVRRVCIVVTSLTAIVLCDMLSLRFGTDYLK